MAVTNWTNITTYGQILAEANNQTSGLFWSAMNFMVFAVLFLTLAGVFGWEAALFSSGFVSIILSVFLMYLGLQSTMFTGMIIGFILIVFILIMWSNRYN